MNMPRPKMFRKGNFVFVSWVDKVEKQMKESERKCRLKAVRYLKVKLKQLIKNKWGKGDLYKGVDYYHGKIRVSKIGFHKPAYHAHLIELGTDWRFVKNFRGIQGREESVGRHEKEPFFKPFLMSEAKNVELIIAKEWLHNV